VFELAESSGPLKLQLLHLTRYYYVRHSWWACLIGYLACQPPLPPVQTLHIMPRVYNLTNIALLTSNSAMTERPRELGDFKGVGHFEAIF